MASHDLGHSIRGQKGQAGPADVAAIGLSGQMHGSVFLDKRNRVIRRALLWNDRAPRPNVPRSTPRRRPPQADQDGGQPGPDRLHRAKILWLRNHEPRNFDKLAKVLLPKDEIRRRLTGEYATEVSDASGTLLLDVARRRWSTALLSKLELEESLLPRLLRIRGSHRQAHARGGRGAGPVDRLPGRWRGRRLRRRGGR